MSTDNRTHDFIADCLDKSQHLSLVTLSADFTITECNAGFSTLLQSPHPLAGRPLCEYLLAESRKLLNPDIVQQQMPLRLHFRPVGGGSVSLRCTLLGTESGYLLFGDHVSISESDILQKMSTLNNEMASLTRELNRKNRELIEAREQIRTLTGIIPICMYCKEIRDDEGFWNQLEIFIERHSEAKFSHGICDSCMEDKFGDRLKK